MKKRSIIGILVLLMFCVHTTAFATNVKLVEERKGFSLLNLFKGNTASKSNAVAVEPDESPAPSTEPGESPTPSDEPEESPTPSPEAKDLTALSGSLKVEKNTPAAGILSYETTLDESELNLRFTIGAIPEKGEVELAEEGKGAFTYTPNVDELGTDSFTFIVEDTISGLSDTGTINILIEEPVSPSPSPEAPSFRYEDMLQHWGEYSAIKLAEQGILQGIQLRNKYYFYPDTQMTRGDFILYLVSALNLDTKQYEDVASPFADADIPLWLSLPAKAAFDSGIIHGSSEDGALYLRPYDKLTRVDAVMMLNNTVKPNPPSANETNFTDMYLVPEWATQAVTNMTSYGILNGYDDNTFRPFVKVNRAMAAELLWQTLKYNNEHPEMMNQIYSKMDKMMLP